jgi:hypothetical protein
MSRFGSRRVTIGGTSQERSRALALSVLAALATFALVPGSALAAVPEVPSLGEWGLLLLSLILLTGGWFAVRRTNRPPPEQNRDPGGS